MSTPTRICVDDRARRAALRDTDLNGLDYVEVDEDDRHRLTVTLMAPPRHKLGREHFVISGGRRVRDLRVVDVEAYGSTDRDREPRVQLTVDRIGDFSTYRLCVVDADDDRPTDRPHPDFDPVYACLDLSFVAGCPSPLDCREDERCPEPPVARPDIDYLAKDYASFRQLLLNRLAVTVPGWTERHEPDLLITLVELLAYEGDRLSYLQDAVATEAYLHTARRRVSVRRHTRLVDYFLHEGCNARAWVFVEAEQDSQWMPWDDFYFVTGYPGVPPAGTVLTAAQLEKVPGHEYEVFEPMPEPRAETAAPPAPQRPADLCRRVQAGSDAAGYLRAQLRRPVVAALDAWDGRGDPPDGLAAAVLAELDRLAHAQALHTAGPFAPLLERGRARQLLQRPLRRVDLVELNWHLLRAAFEDELSPPDGVRFLACHNRIVIHTWGERDCCLPRGTTAAALVDARPGSGYGKGAARERCLQLAAGDWLLFEEVRDPRTGLAEDADPTRRHVVRLTRVTRTVDPVLGLALLDVEWAVEDALPFPLCLSSRGPAPECEWFDEVSVARGNVVLCDYGRRRDEELEAVEVDAVDAPCDDCVPEQELVPRRYRPVLDDPGLTFAEPLVVGAPATARLAQDPRAALPQVRLRQVPLAPPRLDVPDSLERYRNPVPLTAFDPEDLVSAVALLTLLKHPASDADRFLRERLDSATRAGLEAYNPPDDPPDDLVAGLMRALDAALDDDDLQDDPAFRHDGLDEATRALLEEPSLPLDLRRVLRRWLLEQAWPAALAPSPRWVRDWWPRYDLLASTGDDRHFVVEMTDERRASLRFGDDELGERPEPASRFRARYRAGNGEAGNVGAGTVTHLVRRSGPLGLSLTPRNPLPAVGGTEPEDLAEARQRAPYAIRRNLARAVTAEDYATLAARDLAAELQGASAELVWTGSGYDADVTLDPRGRDTVAPELAEAARVALEHYRRMGHSLHVAATRYVPLEIVVAVCVEPGHQRAHVQAALEDAFTSGLRADGGPGFFHPDNLRFRTHIDVSDIVALAQQVEGVLSCRVTKLERLGAGPAGELAEGTLAVGTGEIPQVNSRPGFPELGSITFVMEGGR